MGIRNGLEMIPATTFASLLTFILEQTEPELEESVSLYEWTATRV